MADRRRTNPPKGGTVLPVYTSTNTLAALEDVYPHRIRQSDELRKIFLQTGLVPSASGSAYLELHNPTPPPRTSLIPSRSSLKLTCAVHGPRPIPRNAAFSANLVLNTYVKFAPFASRRRWGYVREAVERDLGVHLETALRGAVIAERWPKAALDVMVTVLESEDDRWFGNELGEGGSVGGEGWGMMTVLAGCITAASAAIIDAGVDCVDLVTGGVAAVLRPPTPETSLRDEAKEGTGSIILDPCPSEHKDIQSACVVGYLQNRDEVTELWVKGDGIAMVPLVDHAVRAAAAARDVLSEVLRETAMEQSPGSTRMIEEEAP